MSSRLLSNQTLLEGMATVGFSQPLADKKRAIQEQIEACVFKLVCCDGLPARHIQLSAQRPIEFICLMLEASKERLAALRRRTSQGAITTKPTPPVIPGALAAH